MTRSSLSSMLVAVAALGCRPAPEAAAPAGNAAVSAVTPRFNELAGWIVQTAEQVPDSLLGYKPNPAVRSMGELLGHVANAHYLFCSAALGETAPEMPDYEKVTDRTALATALKASVTYCERAYGITDAVASEQTSLFNNPVSRLGVLVWNATHDGEHYGNLVVYMRANNIVPPSSQGGN